MERKFYYIKDGKIDRASVMKNAWRLHRSPISSELYREDFNFCLEEIWYNAQKELGEYNVLHGKVALKHTGHDYRYNVLREMFLNARPDNRYADSSWR